jgi:ankyrin repeat protein
LRLDRSRSDAFVRAARALLDAGASATTGFFDATHQPHPEFESVLYGAAGVAHHPALTALLLERGADPNDEEVAYHTPETYDNDALKLLVQTGRLTEESLGIMLLRKTDWHDQEGVKYLLEHGADPNGLTRWGKTALHNAVISDNALPIIETLIDHGADPTIEGTHPEVSRSAAGKTALALAARRGRGDVLDLFQRRGISIQLAGVDQLIAACARSDRALIDSIVRQQPALLQELRVPGGRLLGEFAGNGNTEGVRNLLDLGIDVATRWREGDPYFELARNSTALHAAAWRARHPTVKFLIARGAPLDLADEEGRTPLALAVRACVDSWWSDRRSPESVRALLEAGASVRGVPFPSGYKEVDELLKKLF